jgi:hypothetical protein
MVPLGVELGVDLVGRPIGLMARLARGETTDMLELGDVRDVGGEASLVAQDCPKLGDTVDVVLALATLGDRGGILLHVGGPHSHLALRGKGFYLLEGAGPLRFPSRPRGRLRLLVLLALLGRGPLGLGLLGCCKRRGRGGGEAQLRRASIAVVS